MNVVVDALNRKLRGGLSSLHAMKIIVFKEFRSCVITLAVTRNGSLLAHSQLRLRLIKEVVRNQLENYVMKKLMEEVKGY